MSDDLETTREDLAFLRALAEGPEQPNRTMGPALFAAGLIYGFQVLVQWAAAAGLIALHGLAYMLFIIGCSVAFAIALTVLILKNRGTINRSINMRAFEAAFAGMGLANLAIVLVFVVATVRLSDSSLWYVYTPVVFTLQGGAWFVAFRLRKRNWMGAISVGWFLAALSLVMTVDTNTYILIVGVAMLALLALPGWIMMRLQARAEAQGQA